MEWIIRPIDSTKCLKMKKIKNAEKIELTSRNYYKPVQLPLKIMRLGDEQVLWHEHKDFYELVIVCNGSARNENNIHTEIIHAGNVFLMPEQTSHRYYDLKNFRYYNILFHPCLLKMGGDMVHLESLAGYRTLFDFQFNGENRCSKLLTLNEAALTKVVVMLSELYEELTNRQPGWYESAYFMFMRILVTLLRESPQTENSASENVFPIGKALRLMEHDCTQKFTLRTLADTAGMSMSCFRHNFTRITGLPPMEYLMTLRLRKALLLLNGPSPVSVVAELSGFSDSNYFSRLVRKYFNCSPLEIRRKYNSGELDPDILLKKLQSTRLHTDEDKN